MPTRHSMLADPVTAANDSAGPPSVTFGASAPRVTTPAGTPCSDVRLGSAVMPPSQLKTNKR